MARREIDAFWDRKTRNNLNENFKELYDKDDNIQQQVNDLVLESGGDSNLEVVQARGGHRVLNDRLNSIDSQLAQKADKVYVDKNKRDKSVPIGLNDVGSDLLNAIQGDTNIEIQSIPRDGSVDPLKTDFIERSKNIFNKKDIVQGYVLSRLDGSASPSSSGNSHSGYIRVEPSTTYTKNWSSPDQHCYYDETKQFIIGGDGKVFTTPENCYFIRVNFPGSTGDGLQIEQGGTETEYMDYHLRLKDAKYEIGNDELLGESVSPDKTDFIERSKNLFNKNDVVMGRVVSSSNGRSNPTSGFNSHSNFIEVKPNTTYTRNFNVPAQVAFYEEPKEEKFITGINQSGPFTTPDNCKHIRFNFPNSFLDLVQLEEGDESTPFAPYGDKLKREYDDDVLMVAYEINDETSKLIRGDGITSLEELDKKYPFNSIKLCNVKTTKWGATRITYENEEDFTRDGSNGEVMVEFPKVYFKRYRKGNYEFLEMSGKPKEGFWLDPAFIEDGKELDVIYMSAYDGAVENGRLRSRSGVMATGGYSITEFRDFAKANGRGFGLYDYRTLALLQRLFMIYFADRNSQSALGSGLVAFSWQSHSETLARVTASQTNTIRINHTYTHYKNRGFAVGQLVSIVPSGEYFVVNPRTILSIDEVDDTYTDITFDGEPVDLTAGVSRIYSIPQKSGHTDGIKHHTGVSNVFDGRDGHEAIKFLHVENLWGNIWPFIDGFVVSDLIPYFGENMSDYTSDIDTVKDKYVPLSYKLPLQDTNNQDEAEETFAYVKSLVYEKQHPAYMPPHLLGGGSGPETMFSDPFYSHETGDYVALHGGGIDHMFRAGLFTLRIWYDFHQSNNLLWGSRIQYKPI